MLIHTIAFNNSAYTTAQARSWLRRHHYEPIKQVHKTKNWFRYRIRDPNMFRSFVTKKEGNINFIFGII